jgi:hypothetical protein
MKNFSLFVSILIFSGCAMIGTNMIHSPTSEEGRSWKHRHVHGGATKKAPPDAIIFDVNDSMSVIVGAQNIWEKKNFGGILFPIFPIFWLPKNDYYKNYPNTLIIEVSTIGKIQKFEIISATISSNGNSYGLRNIRNSLSLKELEFDLNAGQTKEFDLTGLTLKLDDKIIELPTIKFDQMKQRWRFLGP